MSPNEQALLFRVGGLGDLLVALPAISLVRRSLPRFSLTLVGRPEYGALLKRAGLVDEVLSFDDVRVAEVFRGPDRAASGATAKADPAAAWLGEFSLALGWLNRDRDWPGGGWWARRGVARAFFTCFDRSADVPMSRFFFDRTGDFLNTPSDRCFDEFARLTIPSVLREKALADLGLRKHKPGEKRLVVHPGSGGRAKCWPLAGFLEIIRWAGSLGVPGVLVTGQAETDLEAKLDGRPLPDGWSKVARLPAETLAGLLSEATHYLGNDSGPTHLAAACGASVLALFREDNVPAWRPFGKTRILAAPAVEAIAIQSVLNALQDLLAE
ncbi:MAG: glycosyltransferase family 9 protein [Candidatus Aminicenantales bacterium]